jgi:hypoxanthine phosphoribosyltransferase
MIDDIRKVMAQAECLADASALNGILDTMAEQLGAAVSGENPIVMCVMNGGLILTGMLLPRLNFPLQVDYLHATRYRERLTGADLQWKAFPSLELSGRVVVLVDDILDEGDTLVGIRDYCLAQGAARVLCAVLVDKNHERRHPALPRAEITGMDAPDRYLFGFGMDYKGYLRNAPGIYAVAEA